MASPAVDARLLPAMAVQTPPHPETVRTGDAFHRRYIAMTGATVDFAAKMHHMREINMIREIVDPDPGDRFLLLPVGQQLLDFRSVGGDEEVAGPAIRHRREAGERRFRRVRVAVEAVHAVVAGMDLMAEGQGLER